MDEFEKEMKKQKKQSGKKGEQKKVTLQIPDDISTKFVGYEKLEIKSKINFVQQDNSYLWIVTNESPLYVESGGQVSDQGFVTIHDHTYPILQFFKLEKTKDPAIAIKIEPKKELKIGDQIHCVVDYAKRKDTQKSHTTTHMLQTALNQVLGLHIKQAGSFVNNEYLRFDFNHHQPLTKKEIEKVENIVNEKIQENINLNIFTTTLKEATQKGITAFFGEKYTPEKVRVVQIPDFSAELCGGTHVQSTGEIGCFKIESQDALSAGVRRITALTGPAATKLFQQSYEIAKKLCTQFSVKIENLIPSLQKQQEDILNLQKEVKHLKNQLWKSQIPIWQKEVKFIGKIPFLFLEVEDLDGSQLKQICTQIESKAPGFYFVICKNSKNPDQINFFGYLSKKWEQQVNLKEFVKLLKDKFEFRGGGSSTLIQGSGKKGNVEILKNEIENWIKII